MKRVKRLVRSATLLFIMLGMPLFTGCTFDNVRQGLYEGVRTRNDLQSSPPERAGKPDSLDYGEYERLRKEQGYSK